MNHTEKNYETKNTCGPKYEDIHIHIQKKKLYKVYNICQIKKNITTLASLKHRNHLRISSGYIWKD